MSKIKIEIEVDESDLACVWADATWAGQHDEKKRPIAEIVADVVNDASYRYREHYKRGEEKLLALFRARFAKDVSRRPVETLPGIVTHLGTDEVTGKARCFIECTPDDIAKLEANFYGRRVVVAIDGESKTPSPSSA